jgi:hypothetical protein
MTILKIAFFFTTDNLRLCEAPLFVSATAQTPSFCVYYCSLRNYACYKDEFHDILRGLFNERWILLLVFEMQTKRQQRLISLLLCFVLRNGSSKLQR